MLSWSYQWPATDGSRDGDHSFGHRSKHIRRQPLSETQAFASVHHWGIQSDHKLPVAAHNDWGAALAAGRAGLT
jgi:hypothetical protein